MAINEVATLFPGDEARVLWADVEGSRAIAVVTLDFDDPPYLHQVVCLREGDRWHAWTSAPAPGWVELDAPFGVATRCDPVEPGTTVVRLEHFGLDRDVEVDRDHLFQALWDVERDGQWEWPQARMVMVKGVWRQAAPGGRPTATEFLVDCYVNYEATKDRACEWAWEAIMELCRQDPAAAWPLVRQAIDNAPSAEVLFTIAAGPLEDLIGENTKMLVQLLETEPPSPALKAALSGVWVNVTDAELSKRLANLGVSGNKKRA